MNLKGNEYRFGVAAALLSINAWDDALNFIETLQKIGTATI